MRGAAKLAMGKDLPNKGKGGGGGGGGDGKGAYAVCRYVVWGRVWMGVCERWPLAAAQTPDEPPRLSRDRRRVPYPPHYPMHCPPKPKTAKGGGGGGAKAARGGPSPTTTGKKPPTAARPAAALAAPMPTPEQKAQLEEQRRATAAAAAAQKEAEARAAAAKQLEELRKAEEARRELRRANAPEAVKASRARHQVSQRGFVGLWSHFGIYNRAGSVTRSIIYTFVYDIHVCI